MKIIQFIIIGAMSVFLSCKKGEDDPAFSFKSRSSRLEGNWVLTSAKVAGTYDHPTEEAADFVFTSDGENFTLEFDSIKQQGPHQLILNFDKKGALNVKETFFTSGFDMDCTWDFLGKSEDAKSKERIIVVPEEVLSGNTSDFHPFFFPSMSRVYRFTELSGKRLVMVYEGDPYMEKKGETLHLTAQFVFGR